MGKLGQNCFFSILAAHSPEGNHFLELNFAKIQGSKGHGFERAFLEGWLHLCDVTVGTKNMKKCSFKTRLS